MRYWLDDLRDWLEDAREHAVFRFENAKFWLFGLVCRVRGHAPRVPGDWPEDSVCPRCGDVEVSCGFTIAVVRSDDEVKP